MPTRGVVAIDRGRLAVGRGLETQRGRRVAQVEAGDGAVDAEGEPDEPRAGGQPCVRHGTPPGGCPGSAHRIQSLEGLDGADEQRGREGDGPGHDVETVVHAVDKVHVGDARRPEHDLVPGRGPHPGMRRAIVRAHVGLDLDDPADTAACPGSVRIADEAGAEQRPGGVERVPGEQLSGKRTWGRVVTSSHYRW